MNVLPAQLVIQDLERRVEALENRATDQLAPNPFAVELAGLSAYLQVLAAAKRQLAQYGEGTIGWPGPLEEEFSAITTVPIKPILVEGAQVFLTAHQPPLRKPVWFITHVLPLATESFNVAGYAPAKPKAGTSVSFSWLVISPGP